VADPDPIRQPDLQLPALAVSGLSFSYPKVPNVLKDVNLQVLSGEKVGIVGPNGTGKTTLFFLICGVLRPSAGRITLFDRPMKYGEFRSEIGLIFQNPDDQLFSPSVRDDVAFGPQNLGLSKAEVDVRVEEALGMAGVLDLADRPPHHLSGGEKRMVAVAGVSAMCPRLVIYDEPSSNLDIRSRRRLIGFLQAMPGTLLIASHDLEFILEVCGRVILLDEGQIVADGPPRDILGDARLMDAHGLECPHSLVAHEIPHHD
jgi:cobalt/nickel transport system ATP-binding protein